MKRLLIGVVIGSLLGVSGVAATEDLGQDTPRQAAKALARDYLAPLVRPDTKRVTITRPSATCRDLGRWNGCRVIVQGAVTCNAVVRVLDPKGGEYTGWIPRMRCR